MDQHPWESQAASLSSVGVEGWINIHGRVKKLPRQVLELEVGSTSMGESSSFLVKCWIWRLDQHPWENQAASLTSVGVGGWINNHGRVKQLPCQVLELEIGSTSMGESSSFLDKCWSSRLDQHPWESQAASLTSVGV